MLALLFGNGVNFAIVNRSDSCRKVQPPRGRRWLLMGIPGIHLCTVKPAEILLPHYPKNNFA